MKEAYYFSHDSNARHDPNILAMRSIYGMEGYGRYWVLIEMLREQSDYKLQITKYTWNALAMQMQCSAEEAQKFVSDCINEFNLLCSDGEFIWSESLIRRMEGRTSKSEKARKAAQARWGKKDEKNQKNQGSMHLQSSENTSNANADADAYADAMQWHCESNAIKEKKEKEKKGKEKKEDALHASDAHASSLHSSQTQVSDYERDILSELWKVENYPADEAKDLELIRTLAEEYPTVELLLEARKWRTYKLDKPLIPGKHNPRSQFRSWIKKAAEWQQESDKPDESSYEPPYWQKWKPDEDDGV